MGLVEELIKMGKGSCLLCFQVIKKTICDVDPTYSPYKDLIFKCCCRLLGEKIKGSSFNWSYSKDSCSPFCTTCFQSSEKLWKIEDTLITIKKELEKYIETFSTEILETRLVLLSQKFSTSENNIEDGDMSGQQTVAFLKVDAEVPMCHVKDTSSLSSNGNMTMEVMKEEVEVSFDDYDDNCFEDGFADSPEENPLSSPLENHLVEVNSLNSRLSKETVEPLRQSPAFSTLKELKISLEPLRITTFKELRISLERLQFDSHGKVIQPTCKDKILKRVKCKTTVATTTKTASRSRATRRQYSLVDVKATKDFGGTDDEEFTVADLNFDSDSSDDFKDKIKKRVRRKVNLNAYKELKCIVCSSKFKKSAELDAHSQDSGHVNERSVECETCSKKFYRTKDFYDHKRHCNFVRSCNICSETFTSFWIYKGHMKQHKSGKNIEKLSKKPIYCKGFKCVVCSSEFKSSSELDDHSTESGHVNERSVECPKCSKTFYRTTDLCYHRKICNFESKTCPYCPKTFTSFWMYKGHVQRHEKLPLPSTVDENEKEKQDNKILKCNVCSATFNFAVSLDFHSKDSGHVNERQFKCTKCHKSYYTPAHLKHHEKFCDFISQTCKYCNKVCLTRSAYFHHTKSHEKRNSDPKNNSFKFQTRNCLICEKEFTSYAAYTSHIKTHKTGNNLHKCNKCPAQFVHRYNLYAHRDDHLIGTKVQCEICHLFYVNADTLYMHIQKQHNGEKKIQCESCDMTFTEKFHFVAHQISTHGMESPYKCKYCENTFSYKFDLTRHLQSIHDIIPPKENEAASCDVCGKTYKSRQQFSDHVLSHTNVLQGMIKIGPNKRKQSFQCDECGRVFAGRRTLNRHYQVTHSSDKPTCHICGKIVVNLKKHLRAHSGQVRFTCDICGRGFLEKHNLKRHKFRIHELNKTPRKSYIKTPNSKPR